MATISAQRTIRNIHFAGGLLLGAFLGFTVLHSCHAKKAPPTVAQLAERRAELDRLEDQVAASLPVELSVTAGDVTLTLTLTLTPYPSWRHDLQATVVLDLPDESLTADQIRGITGLVAGTVDGLDDGHVVLMDEAGHELNTEWLRTAEDQAMWTDVAITVAKILGSLTFLFAVQILLRAITRWRLKEDA